MIFRVLILSAKGKDEWKKLLREKGSPEAALSEHAEHLKTWEETLLPQAKRNKTDWK